MKKQNIFSPCDINLLLLLGESIPKHDVYFDCDQNGQPTNSEIDTLSDFRNWEDDETYRLLKQMLVNL